MSMETNHTFGDLAQVVEHELFPDVDLALRRGRHIDREDAAWYGFLTDAQALLEGFYRRYGAELVQRTDGFFFLLPSGDKLGRRHLSPSEMLVGQGLTLLYLEPATVEQGGVTSRDQLLAQLSASMGTEQLMLAFNAKKKRMDERVAQEIVRTRVSEATRRLAGLGFVELLPEDRIRLRSSLMRFAEPVRGSGADLEALTRLVASGEVALTDDDESPDSDETESPSVSAKSDLAAAVPEWNEGTEWGASFDSPDTDEQATDYGLQASADAEPEAQQATDYGLQASGSADRGSSPQEPEAQQATDYGLQASADAEPEAQQATDYGLQASGSADRGSSPQEPEAQQATDYGLQASADAEPKARSPEPGARSPEPEARSPEPEARSPEPDDDEELPS
jgi:chromosome partition protein MukE